MKNKPLLIFGIIAIVLGAILLAYLLMKPQKSTCSCKDHATSDAPPVNFPQMVEPTVGTEPSFKPVQEIDFLAELETLEV